LARIEFELLRRVASLKECAAWIVWSRDQQWEGRIFRPVRAPDWIDEGRRNRRLLPWVMSQAEYDAPTCIIQRDWLRLGNDAIAAKLTDLIMFLGLLAHREFGRQRGWIAAQFRISPAAMESAMDNYNESQIEKNVMGKALTKLNEKFFRSRS